MAGRGAEFVFRAIDQVSGEAGKVVDSLGKVNQRQQVVARELAGLKRIVGGVSAAFTAGSAALIKFTHAGDEIAKSARKIGVSSQTYQSLGLAVRDAGGSTQGLYTGLRQLTRVVGETAAGTGEGRQAFDALGISIRDAGGNVKSTDDLLIEINQAMEGVGSEAEKANIANRLFGRGWTDLNVVMKEGGDAITNAQKRAEDLGVIISTDLLTKTEQATSQWEKLGTTFESVAIKVAASFGGESGAIAHVQDFLSATSKMLDETSGRGLSAFGAILEGVQYQIVKVTDALGVTEGGAAAFEQAIIDTDNMRRAAAAAGGELEKLGESYQGLQEITSTPLVDRPDGAEGAEGGEDWRLDDDDPVLADLLDARTQMLEDAFGTDQQLLEEIDAAFAASLAQQQKELLAKQQANAKIVGGFANLLGVMGQHSKTALAISKGIRIAETVMSAIQATQAAYNHGMTIGGPALAASLAAKAKIVGGLNIAAVTAVQLGSGSQVATYDGGGGDVRYAPAQATPTAPTSTTTQNTGPVERTIYQVTLPPDNTTPDPVAVTRLLDTLREASERTGGGLELQFGVQT